MRDLDRQSHYRRHLVLGKFPKFITMLPGKTPTNSGEGVQISLPLQSDWSINTPTLSIEDHFLKKICKSIQRHWILFLHKHTAMPEIYQVICTIHHSRRIGLHQPKELHTNAPGGQDTSLTMIQSLNSFRNCKEQSLASLRHIYCQGEVKHILSIPNNQIFF